MTLAYLLLGRLPPAPRREGPEGRRLKSAADKDPSALTLLPGMLPAVDAILADVQAALGQRN
jgi:hypothetical protein